MSFVDDKAREINFKIVYYGPGLCGKTTNLQYIYNKTHPDHRTQLTSLATDTARTLFCSIRPQSLAEISGFKPRFHLHTVPGPVFYDASRQLVLKGLDGIVFVADSQRARLEANLESQDNLIANLEAQGTNIANVPMVLQYNKRDLPTAMPIEELDQMLRTKDWERFESVAPKGIGVFETLKSIAKKILTAARGAQE